MKIMLLGSGELGKEVAISAKRLGIDVIAVDNYHNAPAMQVSDNFEVIDMKNASDLTSIVKKHKPDYILPEVENINTDILSEIDCPGSSTKVMPSVKAVQLTMNRDNIRDYVYNTFGSSVRISKFKYAHTLEEFKDVVKYFTGKFVVKPCMSSSGKGQMICDQTTDVEVAWNNAITNSRGNSNKVIVEEFINFSYEVTMLVVIQKNKNTLVCDPIIHYQSDGDYKWSSHNRSDYIMDTDCLEELQNTAIKIANSVAGQYDNIAAGIFGVEFFICKNDSTNTYYPIFSELSPRPHDTGMVTMRSQKLSQFDLHLRAIIGLPISNEDISNKGGVSVTINTTKHNTLYKIDYDYMAVMYNNYPNIEVRYFGKKIANIGRRMGVILGDDLKQAISARNDLYKYQKEDFLINK